MAEQAPFAKDFGYLTPFLQKVKAHADSLGEGPVKAELQALLSGQLEEWDRVKTLLAGAPPKAAASPNLAQGPAAQGPVTPLIKPQVESKGLSPKVWSVGSSMDGDPIERGSAARPGLTVGSLIGVKRNN